MARLLVIKGADEGKQFDLTEPVVSLGRDASSHIRLHDTEVSRRHAEIRQQGAGFQLCDAGSANGTFVNNQKITHADLKAGDHIAVGQTVLIFSGGREPGDALAGASGLAQQINLITKADVELSSAIIKTIGESEGSRILLQPEKNSPWLRGALADLAIMYEATQATSHILDIDQLLDRILELIFRSICADRGCILLRDTRTGDIVPRVFRHRPGLRATDRMGLSRSIVDYVLRNRQGVRTSDARSDIRFTPGQSILQGGIREAICVPMQGRYDLQGAVYIDITTPPERALLDGLTQGRFNEELLRLMVAIARQSALAVEDNRYQQALVKAERLAAVGQTIAILSHHIKNILQGVRGGSYLIDMGLKDHSEDLVRKGWGIVEKNQQKIYHLVMDMLTFSKERQPVLQPADLNATVADVCELLGARAAELGVTLHWAGADSLPAMSFDAEAIHRAALNIVGNALDAVEGRDGGTVHVSTAFDPATGLVSVVIADNGPGISSELLPQLFNIFESTKGARGTGIGLAVSQKIIREHGGEIFVESQPGSGARFILEWPVIEVEPALGTREAEPGEGLAQRDE